MTFHRCLKIKYLHSIYAECPGLHVVVCEAVAYLAGYDTIVGHICWSPLRGFYRQNIR